MAQSPAHTFGQIIGDVLERAVEPLIAELAERHGLYWDKKGLRLARGGRKLSWVDLYGNTHELDYVVERGGTERRVGVPVAFIEVAWRRYTKHSKNKAQEIQGAILPLVATHRNVAPFTGAVVAGDFTASSLAQLRSQGFCVAHLPTETVLEAFKVVGIDANYGEATPDAEVDLPSGCHSER